ncbi:hypothetical protein EVAR_99582_1 [Eumeta japonica]|uniref:Uncharacterized protein n=1 Tax=Eumeta variegata TaxID=151549 RepID=A0A4C1ZLW6_EUMVA|nr:hypothetical protein EVAR_99582_1 [Eumeta japonica]
MTQRERGIKRTVHCDSTGVEQNRATNTQKYKAIEVSVAHARIVGLNRAYGFTYFHCACDDGCLMRTSSSLQPMIVLTPTKREITPLHLGLDDDDDDPSFAVGSVCVRSA